MLQWSWLLCKETGAGSALDMAVRPFLTFLSVEGHTYPFFPLEREKTGQSILLCPQCSSQEPAELILFWLKNVLEHSADLLFVLLPWTLEVG